MFISRPLSGKVYIFGQYFVFVNSLQQELVSCVYTRHTGETCAIVGEFIRKIRGLSIDEIGTWPAGVRWRSWKMRELEAVFLVFQGGGCG